MDQMVRMTTLFLVLLLPYFVLCQNDLQEDPCPPKLDVAFVMDTSGSIELVYAEHVKWTMALAEILPIRQDAVRLSVIQYASYPLTEFSLSTYSSADNVRKHLQQITFQAGVTRTGYALRKAESELFRADKGARNNADKLLILFSDGLSIDDPIKVSETLRNEKNVTLYVVSVGSDGFATEMERIAGTHADTYGPKDLDKLKNDVIKKVENARICVDGQRLSSLTTSSTTTTTETTTTTTTTTTPAPTESSSATTTTTEPPSTTTHAPKREEKQPITLKPFVTSHTTPRRAISAIRPLNRGRGSSSLIGSQSVSVAPIQLTNEGSSHSIERRRSSESKQSSKQISSHSRESEERRVVPRTSTTTTTTTTEAPTSTTTTTRRPRTTRRPFVRSTTSTTTTTTESPTTTTTEIPPSSTTQAHRRAPSTRRIIHNEETTTRSLTRATAKPWKNPNAPKSKKIESEEISEDLSPVVFDSLFTTTARSSTSSTTERVTTETTTTATTTHRPTTSHRTVTRSHSSESREKKAQHRNRAFAVRNQAIDDDNGCQVDVLLIVDSSGSVHDTYETQKTFLASILEEIDVSTNSHRVALIQFAGQNLQKIEWTFDEMQANEQLMKAFGRIRHFTGTTYIGAALHAARKMLENKRKGVKTLVVLLSDGYSHDDTSIDADEIRALSDVEVFAVSVARFTNNGELKKITGDESKVFVGKEAEFMREILINKLRCAA